MFLYINQISCSTRKQKTAVLSLTEAEFMSLRVAIQESVWLKGLDAELNLNSSKTMLLYCDNKAAIQVALNNSDQE